MAQSTQNLVEGSYGYLDWPKVLLNKNPSTRIVANKYLEPIYVRTMHSPVEFFTRILSTTGLYYSTVKIIRETPSAPFYAHIYRDPGVAINEDFYDVLEVGALTTRGGNDVKFFIDQPPGPGFVPDKTVAGIIDDGVGYLNNHFARRGEASSRFVAVWLQSLAAATNPAHPHRVSVGRVLSKANIEYLLRQMPLRSEADLYASVNATIFPDNVRRPQDSSAGHGTHMLDLFAGSDPQDVPGSNDDLTAVPLLAVQLPPPSFEDTSGVRLQTHVLMGLRWMIIKALAIKAKNLIVNASLGVTAGSKDGSSFLHQQILREIESAAADGLNVEVVFPYGNSFDLKQICRVNALPETDVTLPELRLPRDDFTSSFLEIRAYDNQFRQTNVDPFSVKVTAPTGEVFGPYDLASGQHKDLEIKGKLVARLYHAAARLPMKPWFLLAFAPTEARQFSSLTAPAGSWSVTLGNEEVSVKGTPSLR